MVNKNPVISGAIQTEKGKFCNKILKLTIYHIYSAVAKEESSSQQNTIRRVKLSQALKREKTKLGLLKKEYIITMRYP